MPPVKAPVLSGSVVADDVVLSWTTSGPRPDTFTVYCDGVGVTTVPYSTLTYTDTTVVSGGTYTYQVRAKRDFTVVSSNPVTLSLDVEPVPTTAPVLSGTAGDSQVSLGWTAVANADAYTLERKVGAGSYSNLLLNQNQLSYLHTGITNGSTYTYRVKATANAGADVGPWSNELPRIPDASIPVAPVLTGEEGDSENTLDWNAVANADRYRVLRSANGAPVTTTETDLTAYVDDSALNDNTYQYHVRGLTAGGLPGALSNPVTLTPTAGIPAPDPAPITGLFIAPGGNDANPGTVASPKRTILHTSALLQPGETLWMRGGTYTGQGGYNWKKSGTAGNPVTLKAYPGEVPIINGGGAYSHGIIIGHSTNGGFHDVVIDGIKITNTGRGSSGDAAIYLVKSYNITIQNCQLVDNGANALLDHQIYIGEGCHHLSILNNFLSQCPGGSVHTYHDPGPNNLLVEGNTCRDAHWGVVLASTGIQTVTIRNNTFLNNDINIDLRRATSNVTISGNSPSNAYSGTTPT